ncbi:MAG: 4Fe-4S dicluster domain-containing protein [Bacteroidales bacterium]|nr:4Fe-4S dicluster domain-containing protein [Bacteroidales bacterium]
MKRKILKPIRVAVSLILFALTCGIFADIMVLSSVYLVKTVLYFQFVPSLIGFFNSLSIAALGFLVIILLTLLFGRIYCSSFCPLGTIHDIVIGIRNRLDSGQPDKILPTQYRKALPWISYPILGLTLLLFLFGNLFLFTLLDPFSLAGRFVSGLIGPLFDLPGNPLFFSLHTFRNPAAEETTRHVSSLASLLVTGFMFIVIVFLAIYKNRWYCTVICPVGTLLGLLSRFSLIRIQIHKASCLSCGKCSQVCKSGCIDPGKKELDFTQCVVCFNCLQICSNDGIRYRIFRPALSAPPPEPLSFHSRRDFLKWIALAPAVLAFSKSVFTARQDDHLESGNPYPATPPGSIGFDHYTERCTSCHLCVSACPTGILQPSVMAFGFTGILQPRMNFEAGHCDFECFKCLEICPTGAILPLPLEQKKRIQIGTSQLIKNLCIPVADRKTCGLCAGKCPTKAITMIPFLGELTIPGIDEKTCIGCGACEHICPTRPVRAIYVEPLPVHRIAWKPKEISN